MASDGPIVIIGGGLSGVSFGRLLQLSGFEDFVILEAEDEPGGLCRSELAGGHVLDISGGHFLCSRYPEVYDFISVSYTPLTLPTLLRVSILVVAASLKTKNT